MPRSGYYEVFAWWPQATPHASSARLVTRHREGDSTIVVDQSANGGQWNSLGVFPFDQGADAAILMEQTGAAPLLVDAVRVQFMGTERPSLALRSSALTVAEFDQAYEGRIDAIGGIRPYRFRIVEGSLPPGLEVDPSTGSIAGKAAMAGQFDFVVEIGDSANATVTQALSLDVVEAGDVISGTMRKSFGHVEPSGSSIMLKSAGSSLRDVVAAMPEGEWSLANVNRFSDVWAPAELRPLFGWGNPTPSRIILAWSSFAWDSKRQSLFLYGGGHANYRGNDTYVWRGATRAWERASLPSEMRQDSLGNWNAIDSADAAPASAHTYDNTVYLPSVDRFLVLGGAADSNGAHYMRQATSTTSRRTGPYLFDPNRADGNKVGGTTGSHVQRVSPFPEVVGGNMWSNRENYLNASRPPTHAFVDGCTGQAVEGGKDVVYVRTSAALHRYTLHDLADPAADTWEQVGVHWTGAGSQTTCAYDPIARVLVRTGTNTVPFLYWNLNTAGVNNRDVRVQLNDPDGQFASYLSQRALTISRCAMDHDPVRGRFVLWCGDGAIWSLQAPATLSASGWSISRERDPVLAIPNGEVGTGILGKWKYAPDLDVFIGLQDINQGNVWVYKPIGWNGGDGSGGDTPPTNQAPSVALAQPQEGAHFAAGTAVRLVASATDSDGSVARVAFYRGSTLIAEDTSAPFEIDWTDAPNGTHVLTAVATDDRGAASTSQPVSIFIEASSGGGGATVLLQRGANDYSQSADTYLSTYHKTTALGSASMFQDTGTNYSSLLRFAIFHSDGGPVPNGAAIQSATLSIYKYSLYATTFAIHPLLQDWNEARATWNLRGDGGSWASPGANGAGADYAVIADAIAQVGYSEGWLEFDVTAALQRMSQRFPTGNYGWRLRASGGDLVNSKKFRSSEFAGGDLRPKLTVSYE